jgi:FixJ family two-component response regulator
MVTNLSEVGRPLPAKYTTEPMSVVYVVDDDDSVRGSLEWLIRRAGWQATSFASAAEFLSYRPSPLPSCLLLDLTLPDLNGLDVQEILADRVEMPIIFISGYGDVPTTVRAMKAGAIEFLVKPFCDNELLRAIPRALEMSKAALRDQARLESLRDRYASLSARERQVLERIVSGCLNKQVAADLGVTENTVKVHRCNLMRKMGARSVVELVYTASRLHIVTMPWGQDPQNRASRRSR